MKRTTATQFAQHPRELILAAHIFIFLMRLPFSLRFSSVQAIAAGVEPRGDRARRHPMDPERITYLCERALDRLERLGYKRTCLRRCLTLYRFLRGEGIKVVINFGALQEGETLKGHSWLTLDGALYHETREKVDRFVYFFSIPEAGAGGDLVGATENGRPEDIGKACFD